MYMYIGVVGGARWTMRVRRTCRDTQRAVLKAFTLFHKIKYCSMRIYTGL